MIRVGMADGRLFPAYNRTFFEIQREYDFVVGRLAPSLCFSFQILAGTRAGLYENTKK